MGDDNRQDLDKSGLNYSDLNNESIRLGKLQVDESMRKTNSTLKRSNKNSSKDKKKIKSYRSDFDSFNEIVDSEVSTNRNKKNEKNKVSYNNLIDKSKHKQSHYDESEEEDRKQKRPKSKSRKPIQDDSEDDRKPKRQKSKP